MSVIRPLPSRRAHLIGIAVLIVIIGIIGFFSIRPRLHPPLSPGDVSRLRCFVDADRHYEWLVFDQEAIDRITGWFNSGTDARTDESADGESPHSGVLFILANGNGITVSATSDGAPGEVMVARGQYQYRLTAPELADYIANLARPDQVPESVSTAADRLAAFLTARGRGDVSAEESFCTSNGQDRLSEGDSPTKPLYTGLVLHSLTQEEYSPWQIDQAQVSEALVVWAEWESNLTDYGRQFLNGTAEAEGQGRMTFLMVRPTDGGQWLIEDWQ